jgi:hypothetical protein
MRKKITIIFLLLLILITACNKSEDPTIQTVTGKMVVTVEETAEAKQGVCDNAQNYNMCNDLNLKFRVGYKEDCCTNFGLCC